MEVCRFVLGLYIGFLRLNQLRFVAFCSRGTIGA
jgi:hypothetical protein